MDLRRLWRPKGYLPLPGWCATSSAEQEIAVASKRVLLHPRSSQTMDLAAPASWYARVIAVLVDDPSTPICFLALPFSGRARLVGRARTPSGYDLAHWKKRIVERRPKVFFAQPRLHSPTGSVAQLAHLHRIRCTWPTNTIWWSWKTTSMPTGPRRAPRFASLDQLNRVVYINSFPETISPTWVGYLAAPPDLLEGSGPSSDDFGPDIVRSPSAGLGPPMDGRWRKHLKGLRERFRARPRVADRVVANWVSLFCSQAGMFLWACHHAQLPDPRSWRTRPASAHPDGARCLFNLDMGPRPLDALERGFAKARAGLLKASSIRHTCQARR